MNYEKWYWILREHIGEDAWVVLLNGLRDPSLPKETLNVQKEMERWICKLCGKSTYETEYDYLTSKDMHLECAVEEEINEQK